MRMHIQCESPATPDVVKLLEEHLADMALHSPPESVHALDLSALQAANICFFTARDNKDGTLLGCAALKTLSASEGELKSMRTAPQHRRKGVADALLDTVIIAARQSNMASLSLETGTPDAFAPARKLYQRRGFIICPPFADYTADPFSVCMRLTLGSSESHRPTA